MVWHGLRRAAFSFFFFNDTATTEIYTLSLHDALPISYLDGTVAEVLPGQGARVETTCAFIQGIFGIGGETWGALVLGGASPGGDVTGAHFTSAPAGKIVGGGALFGAQALGQGKTLGGQ